MVFNRHPIFRSFIRLLYMGEMTKKCPKIYPPRQEESEAKERNISPLHEVCKTTIHKQWNPSVITMKNMSSQ